MAGDRLNALEVAIEADYISRDPEIMSGVLCFKGTRVPVQNLIHYLEETASIEIGKKKPGALAYGSSGTASPNRLAITMLEEASGRSFLHVPFKDIGVAFPNLLAGHVQILLSDVVLAIPHVKSGKLIAVVINHKSPMMPEVPTLAEAGYPQLSFPGSFGIAPG